MKIHISKLKNTLSTVVKENRTIGIVIPSNTYKDTVEELAEHIYNDRSSFWLYITVTKPYESIIKSLQILSNAPNVEFIDCISQAAGIVKRNGRCIFVDSPTLLENVIMEIQRLLQKVPSNYNKNILIDSLTALTIYNEENLITEFFYQLTNKVTSSNTHLITLFVEKEGPPGFLEKVLHITDEVIEIMSNKIDFDLEKENMVEKEIYGKEKGVFKEDRIGW